MARLSFVSGLAIFVGFFSPIAIPAAAVAGIWFAVVVGWAWLALTSMHLIRAA
jgi:hypothetical protein